MDPTEPVEDGRAVAGNPNGSRLGRRHLPLRVRAGLAFGLMALVLSATLALAAYALVRASLLSERETIAERQVYTNARLLRSRVDPLPQDMSQLLASLQVGGAGDSLLRIGDQWFSSSVQMTSSELPPSLAAAVDGGDAAMQTFDRFGSAVLGVGVPIASVDAVYFEVSSLSEVEATLSRLGRSLLIAGVIATALGALVGVVLSSAILQPLRRFALVAERISGGAPSTRDADQRGEATTRLDAAGDADLEPLAASFNEMLDELDERIERERRFASDVSHEIRGPVAALASAVAIVDRRRDQLPAEIVPVVDALDDQVHEFNRLVLDLLEISRFDARTASLEIERVDLVALLSRLLEVRGHGHVQLSVDGDDGGVPVDADRRRIEQVVANLLDNASRYGGGATDVQVWFGAPATGIDGDTEGPADGEVPAPGVVRIAVQDRGAGVAPAERQRIFERFERGAAADAPDAPSGTGLGLSLCRQHVELHGGRIWVEDRKGGGASFVVELPREHP